MRIPERLKKSWFEVQHDVPDAKALVEFMTRGASNLSLNNFMVHRFDHDRELKQHILDLVDQAIENMAMVRLAEFLRDNRDAIRENLRAEALGGD